MINLNSTTPAAPNGGTPVIWQNDSSGNVSAYTAKVKTSLNATGGALTINAGLGDSFIINVSGVVSSSTISNPTDGQEITLLWAQNSTGYAVTLPTNMKGGLTVSTTANSHTCQKFTYNAGDGNWYAIGVAGM